MLKILLNSLKVAFRRLNQQKFLVGINLSGLTLATGTGLLLLACAWVAFTINTDHEDAEDIYLLTSRSAGGQSIEYPTTWGPLRNAVQRNYPEVESSTRMYMKSDQTAVIGQKRIDLDVCFVDPAVFDVFTFPLLSGTPENALAQPADAVLTRQTARRLFGVSAPIGETFALDGRAELRVGGVMANMSPNSTIKCDALANFEYLTSNNDFVRQAHDDWNWSFLRTYVRLRDSADPERFQSRVQKVLKTHLDSEKASDTILGMVSLPDMVDRFFINTDIVGSVIVLIGLGVLLIAALNFANLSISRSLERTKEIGLRKAIGASRNGIVLQLVLETMAVLFISLVGGIVLAHFLLPVAGSMFDLNLRLHYGSPLLWLSLLGLWVFLGLLSGLYPSLFLSGYGPASTLRGTISKAAQAGHFRKGVTIFQFAFSVFLIFGVLTMRAQINFLEKNSLQVPEDRSVVVMPVETDYFPSADRGYRAVNAYATEVSKHSSIQAVSVSATIPVAGGMNGDFRSRPGEDPHEMGFTYVDSTFFSVYNVDVKQGRIFSPRRNDADAVIINEAAKRQFGWTDIENRRVYSSPNTSYRVIGVVEDFPYGSLDSDIPPLVMFNNRADSTMYSFVSALTPRSSVDTALDHLRSSWTMLGTERQFTYTFAHDRVGMMYSLQSDLSNVIGFAALVAIFIACMGLLGITGLTVSQRKKEIGVRKALGASTMSIVGLLLIDIGWLVGTAILLALPLGWFSVQNWLQNFAHRIDLGMMYPAISIILVLLLAVLTISYHVAQATTISPAVVLRDE